MEARRSDSYYQVKATIFGALIEAIDLAQLAKLDGESAREEIRDIVNEIIAIKNIVMSIAEQEELLDDICNDVLGDGPQASAQPALSQSVLPRSSLPLPSMPQPVLPAPPLPRPVADPGNSTPRRSIRCSLTRATQAFSPTPHSNLQFHPIVGDSLPLPARKLVDLRPSSSLHRVIP